MSLAIIDAREWQNRFDLETGRKQVEDQDPLVGMVCRTLARNPYPGDIDESANGWVSQTALDLMEHYAPDLICLSYAQQFFANRHFMLSNEEQDRIFSSAMAEAERFIQASGYTPVIIGTGGMVPFKWISIFQGWMALPSPPTGRPGIVGSILPVQKTGTGSMD